MIEAYVEPSGYSRRYFKASEVGVDSAIASEASRIGPRSREYSVNVTRWLPA